jgi:hypothetical protein
MTIYLRVIGGLVGLQVIPYEGRDRSDRENQQHYQKNSFVNATKPGPSAGRAELRSIVVAQFDATVIVCGIFPQRFQPIARVHALADIFRIEISLRHLRIRAISQIATIFAVRESLFGIFADVIHFFGP